MHCWAPTEVYTDLLYKERIIGGETPRLTSARWAMNGGGMGAAGPVELSWPPDSRYVYFTTAREGEPEGCDQYWSRPFSRMNMNDRTVEYIGIGGRSPDGGTIAVWQDANMLALPIEAQAPIAFDLPHPDQQLGALL